MWIINNDYIVWSCFWNSYIVPIIIIIRICFIGSIQASYLIVNPRASIYIYIHIYTKYEPRKSLTSINQKYICIYVFKHHQIYDNILKYSFYNFVIFTVTFVVCGLAPKKFSMKQGLTLLVINKVPGNHLDPFGVFEVRHKVVLV